MAIEVQELTPGKSPTRNTEVVLPQVKVKQGMNTLDSEIVLETQDIDMDNLSDNEG